MENKHFTAEQMIDFGYWLYQNFGQFTNDRDPEVKKAYLIQFCIERKLFTKETNEEKSNRIPIIRG
jgi:hypothetical protein